MPELDNSKPPLFVPSKRSYNDFVLAWRGHSRKRNYSQLLEWAEHPENGPEALTQQQQTWNSRFFSDLVDSLYNGETDDAATAALAAMDAAADDGMQLWKALKREIDITLPSARSHAEDQLKTKTKQKHDETVAEFGLRFRGAVREFKNRGGEMTNYKYAELWRPSTFVDFWSHLAQRKKVQLSFTRIQQELKRSSIIRRRTGERNTSRSDASSSSITSNTKRSKSNEWAQRISSLTSWRSLWGKTSTITSCKWFCTVKRPPVNRLVEVTGHLTITQTSQKIRSIHIPKETKIKTSQNQIQIETSRKRIQIQNITKTNKN